MAKLYLITDERMDPPGLLNFYNEAMLEGLGLFQLRVTNFDDSTFFSLAEFFSELCRKAGAALIINDRPDIAMLVGAAGVHLGQLDLPLSEVRRMVGQSLLIGKSVRNPVQAKAAVNEGANYVALGPCFATSIKPDQKPVGAKMLLRTVQEAGAPVCAIGGISPLNLGEVLDAGPAYVAVITAISRADDPLRIKNFFLEKLRDNERTA